MFNNKINIPKLSVLEVELIINNILYNEKVISELQYHEVCKIIYEKMNQLKNQK